MGAQMTSSFVTTLIYLIILFYGITNFDAVLSVEAKFHLTQIYYQVSGSKAGAIGLTIVVFLPLVGSVLGSFLVSTRVFWTLARDEATPLPNTFGRVSLKWKNPFNAIIAIACFCTVMGCIYLGSHTAFEAFVGSFTVLITLPYLAALVPFLLEGRASVPPGPFYVKGISGYIITTVSCGFMIVWIVFYCFPYTKEFTAEDMNYSSLIAGGLTVLVAIWWLCVHRRYKGPPVLMMER